MMKWEDAGPSEHWAGFQIVRRLGEWLAWGSPQLSEEGCLAAGLLLLSLLDEQTLHAAF